jgi:heptosyltransferase I
LKRSASPTHQSSMTSLLGKKMKRRLNSFWLKAAFSWINPWSRSTPWPNGRPSCGAPNNSERLLESGFQVVFTGSKEDRLCLDDVTGTLGASVSRLDGRTTLKVLAAVYRLASVVVSTDTGPMHLAAAVGTPVVALFGPTAPSRTGPYGKGHLVLRAGVSCSPCFSRSCKTTDLEPMACMNRITVEQVMDAVRRMDAERKSRAGQREQG